MWGKKLSLAVVRLEYVRIQKAEGLEQSFIASSTTSNL